MADEELTIVMAKRKIRWEPAVIVPAPSLPEESPPEIDSQPGIILESNGTQTFVQAKRTYKKRLGNGHQSVKVRDLLDGERDSIRKLFLIKDGQIEDDDCVGFKEQVKWEDIGIFQITGFVSVLHTDVAEGIITLKNLGAYETWMRTKYGETLWARYNLPLYVEIRKQNADLVSQGLPPVKAKKPKKFHGAPELGDEKITILTSVKVKADNPLLTSVFNDQGEVIGIQATNQEGIILKPISLAPKFTPFRKKWAGA